MKRIAIEAFILAGLLALMTGCAGSADKATFDAIAPEYRAYVENDPHLTTEQKQRRFRTLESWQARLSTDGKEE
jgi:hypothetical protein